MISKTIRCFSTVIALSVMFGCAATTETKQQAFPEMYDATKRPVSILVMPAINESTAADATDYYAVTIAEPLTLAGYYVYPLEVVTEILRSEGIADTEMIRGLPPSAFKQGFGADAVLFVTITGWDKTYLVIAANVSVGLEFVMMSTTTEEVLWSYSTVAVVDASGSSGNILVDVISTALSTALTKNVNVAKLANSQALVALPVGSYHTAVGTDGGAKVVRVAAKEQALDP
jgi:hypothetical protein